MSKVAAVLASVMALLLIGLAIYGLDGYFDARSDAVALKARADRLIAQGRGPGDLGDGRVEQLLLVEDPGFLTHGGVDLDTAGSGLTTLTQSVGKRLGFRAFRPGVRKVRLVGYALGLESRLTKPQILALYLDTVWMGPGPRTPMAGFFDASHQIYGSSAAGLSDHDFLSLVAVPIAPRKFSLIHRSPALEERVARIKRLVDKKCQPTGLRDVWLDGCATPLSGEFNLR